MLKCYTQQLRRSCLTTSWNVNFDSGQTAFDCNDDNKCLAFISAKTMKLIFRFIFSCYLATVSSTDVHTEQTAQRSEGHHTNAIPATTETDKSDQLAILPRNDVPFLAHTDNFVLEHSKESNEERTSGSDSAVIPTSSFANADIEPIAKVVPDNDKAIEAAPNDLSSSSTATAPTEIPYVFYFRLFFLGILCMFCFIIFWCVEPCECEWESSKNECTQIYAALLFICVMKLYIRHTQLSYVIECMMYLVHFTVCDIATSNEKKQQAKRQFTILRIIWMLIGVRSSLFCHFCCNRIHHRQVEIRRRTCPAAVAIELKLIAWEWKHTTDHRIVPNYLYCYGCSCWRSRARILDESATHQSDESAWERNCTDWANIYL